MPTRIAALLSLLAVTVATAQTPAPAPQQPRPAILQNYPPVTAERLKSPEDGDWLMIRRTYDGWGYSPLDADHAGQRRAPAAGVGRSRPAMTSGHEAAPIVNNGVMFVATPGNQVIALDARDRHDALALSHGRSPEDVDRSAPRRAAASRSTATKCSSPPAKPCSSRSTRRPARKSGPRQVADNKAGYYMSLAPLIADGKVMVGASGGEFGHPRIRRGLRCRDRQGAVAHVTPFRRRASPAARRGRRAHQWKTGGGSDLGHRQLRSGHQHRVLGHRQRRPVDGRSASRRQSLHLVDHRDRRRDRHDQGLSSSTIRTNRGTGTKSRRRSWSTTSATGEPSRA